MIRVLLIAAACMCLSAGAFEVIRSEGASHVVQMNDAEARDFVGYHDALKAFCAPRAPCDVEFRDGKGEDESVAARYSYYPKRLQAKETFAFVCRLSMKNAINRCGF